jgi:hypothetical protein
MHAHRFLFVFLLVSFLGSTAAAQDIDEDEVILPPPQTIEPPLAPRLMPQGFYPPVFPALPPERPRTGTREAWQYLGVTETGRWRPRVILSPHGAYYYYSGEPYPWPTLRPSSYMPFALD